MHGNGSYQHGEDTYRFLVIDRFGVLMVPYLLHTVVAMLRLFLACCAKCGSCIHCCTATGATST
jgi:hypothetical protein